MAGAVDLFSILAIGGFIQTVATLRTTVIISSGHGKRLWRWASFNSGATIISCIIGLPWGTKGVAIAYTIASYLTLHPLLLYAIKDTPIKPTDFYYSIGIPFLASVTMSVVYILTIRQLQITSDTLVLSISFPFCILLYLSLISLVPKGRQYWYDCWEYIGIVFGREKQSK